MLVTRSPTGTVRSSEPVDLRGFAAKDDRVQVFLSYRCGDAPGHTRRVHDDLIARLGPESVFQDVASIEPGERYVMAMPSIAHVWTDGGYAGKLVGFAAAALRIALSRS